MAWSRFIPRDPDRVGAADLFQWTHALGRVRQSLIRVWILPLWQRPVLFHWALATYAFSNQCLAGLVHKGGSRIILPCRLILLRLLAALLVF